MALTTNFSGLASGIDTKALTEAIMSQESKGLDRLTAQQTKNKSKSTVVTSLKNGMNSLNTSLAVLDDKLKSGDSAAITAAMQDVVTKFNAVQKIYKDNSTITRASDSSIVKGPLADDPTIKNMMSQLKLDFSGSKNTATLAYSNPASIGIKTGVDGTLSMDTAAFQAALTNDKEAVKSISQFNNLKDTISKSTSSTTGSTILQLQQNIDSQNKILSSQILTKQSQLAVKESMYKAQFTKMETAIAQLKAASGFLFNASA